MAKDPAFLFYPGDFNTGTQFFTDEQVGKYVRLLMAQHQHGHLEEKHIMHICKSYDNDIMSKFKKDDDGKWYNERLENEIIRRKEYVKSRGQNRSSKNNISKSYVPHMENETENKTITTIKVDNREPKISFEIFWDKYGKRVGRKSCEPKWNKLKKETQEKILLHLDKYIPATPDVEYRKNPETYLNQESWNDEVIQPKSNLPRFI